MLRIVFLFILIFCAACSANNDRDYSNHIDQTNKRERSVNERLADELIRHGRQLLRSKRYLSAKKASEFAAFLSNKPQCLAFESECKNALAREIVITKNLAIDAYHAGDLRESERLKAFAEAMRQHLEAR